MQVNLGRGSQRYDFPTAVTFLMAGLGIGSLVAMLLMPRRESASGPSRSGGPAGVASVR
jgi:hypothetical protein